MHQNFLITFTVAPALEGSVVDWLLQYAGREGFTSFPVYGHSSEHEGMSLFEEVVGRKKQIRFQLQVPVSELPNLLTRLRQDFAGAGLHYWVMPVLEVGFI